MKVLCNECKFVVKWNGLLDFVPFRYCNNAKSPYFNRKVIRGCVHGKVKSAKGVANGAVK